MGDGKGRKADAVDFYGFGGGGGAFADELDVVAGQMQDDLVKERSEELVHVGAEANGVQAHLGKNVPCAHGTVVLVHLGGIAVRLVLESAADKGLRILCISAVTMNHSIIGQKGVHKGIGAL